MNNYIVCSIGLTAAGKTTTLRKISEVCDLCFISEGSIKREMVEGEYSIKNSTDETLRNMGYKKAISIAFDYIQNNNKSVIIDASFHQQFRRDWIYEEIIKRKMDDVSVIWIYCVCNNEKLIRKRIHDRYTSPIKSADNQANTIGVYNYTKSTFDKVCFKKFKTNIPTFLIVFDTERNKIKSFESNSFDKIFDINIEKWRELWENYM